MDYRSPFTLVNKAITHEGGVLQLLKKMWAVVAEEGYAGLLFRLNFLQFSAPKTPALMEEQYLYRSPALTDAIAEEIVAFKYQPLISVVMPVFNVERRWLIAAVDSLLNQWYSKWELCICDDKSTNAETLAALKELLGKDSRIKIIYAEENGNISSASNQALALASGEYVALMDHDDEVTVDALFEVVQSLQHQPHDFIYSDEDKIEMDGSFVEPHFKPDFSPDLFLCQNYMSHLGVIRKELVDAVGGWTEGVEGAQDYDLYLKVLEKTDQIHHIPKVLYHWRKVPGSTAATFSDKSYAQEAGRLSLELAIARRGINAVVTNGVSGGTYRVKYEIEGEPLVSIVVPFRNKFPLLSSCLNSILRHDKYENFEVICIDNGSDEEGIELLKAHFVQRDSRIKFYRFDEPFNYSKINNLAVRKYCRGEYLVFLNNDIDLVVPDWISCLLEHAQREKVGAVGAKLCYSNMTIQHAGVVLAPDSSNSTINVFQYLPHNSLAYFSRLQSICNYSAVTAALMMVSRKNFDLVGGFDEEQLKIAYNDIDLCLRFLDEGLFNIYTPYVNALHLESASRGHEDNTDKIDRAGRELRTLKERHSEKFSRSDPFYSPNLAQNRTDWGISKHLAVGSESVTRQPFREEIKLEKDFAPLTGTDICIFAHFDADGKIAPYVVYFLEKLKEHLEIVFVSTAENLGHAEFAKLDGIVSKVIVKANVGYDFGSWKTGIDHLGIPLQDLRSLVICNDSSFAPVGEFSEFFSAWKASGANVFGATDSYEVRHHLQSYFLGFDTVTLRSKVFTDFWQNLGIIEDKDQIILEYEIGLSQMLKSNDLLVDSLVPAASVGYQNNTHFRWKELITNYKTPFLKIELLRDNPMMIDLSEVLAVLEKTDYPIGLLESQLGRYGIRLQDFEKNSVL